MSRYEDKLEDLARKAITDTKTVMDIMECDYEEFARRVALMVTPPEYENGMNVVGECLALRAEFDEWLVNQAVQLDYIKRAARNEVSADAIYGSDECLPTGWRDRLAVAV